MPEWVSAWTRTTVKKVITTLFTTCFRSQKYIRKYLGKYIIRFCNYKIFFFLIENHSKYFIHSLQFMPREPKSSFSFFLVIKANQCCRTLEFHGYWRFSRFHYSIINATMLNCTLAFSIYIFLFYILTRRKR